MIKTSLFKLFHQILSRVDSRKRKPIHQVSPDFATELLLNFKDVKLVWEQLKESDGIIKPIDQISNDQKELNRSKKWDALILYAFGNKNRKVLKSAVFFDRFIQKYADSITLVMFSILKPGMQLQKHTGNNHHVLRYQLVIENTGYEKTGLVIDNNTLVLKEKEFVVFDDTFEHEAWNNSNTNRVVLIIDFIKPFPFGLRWMNKLMINRYATSEYVKNGINNW